MRQSRARRCELELGLPLAAVAIFLALFRWDQIIPIVETQVSARLGRPVTLERLHVRLGRTITAQGLRIGHPEGFDRDPPFTQVPRAQAGLELMALLGGKVVIPAIMLERPSLELLGCEDGGRTRAGAAGRTGCCDAWNRLFAETGRIASLTNYACPGQSGLHKEPVEEWPLQPGWWDGLAVSRPVMGAGGRCRPVRWRQRGRRIGRSEPLLPAA